MTPEEVNQLLHQYGWYLAWDTRRSKGKRFAYAKRRWGKGSHSRYLIAERKFHQLTKEEVLKRIQAHQ